MNSKVAVTTTPAVETKLCAEHIYMSFTRDGESLPVLEDINLDVGNGEFLCLLGPSGCGKSTLLSTIAGFLLPTSGEVKIDGEVVRGPDPRRIFVFQERGVFPWLTVEGNIGSSACSNCRARSANIASRTMSRWSDLKVSRSRTHRNSREG